MTPEEHAVMEAALDLADCWSAYEHGIPAQKWIAKAEKSLASAVSALHAAHDGRYQLPDSEDE